MVRWRGRRRRGGNGGGARRAVSLRLRLHLPGLVGRHVAEQRGRPRVEIKVPDRELRVGGAQRRAVARLVRGGLAVGDGRHHGSAERRRRRSARGLHRLHVVVAEHGVRRHDEVGLAGAGLGAEEARARADAHGGPVGEHAQAEGLADGGRRGRARRLGEVRRDALAVTTVH